MWLSTFFSDQQMEKTECKKSKTNLKLKIKYLTLTAILVKLTVTNSKRLKIALSVNNVINMMPCITYTVSTKK